MRLVSRALFSGSHLAARLSRAGNYLAVGTLRLSEMKDAIRGSWEGFYARDEDVASGLMDWERDLVDRFVPTGRHGARAWAPAVDGTSFPLWSAV